METARPEYTVISVDPGDLEGRGFTEDQIEAITPQQMRDIAGTMAECLLESGAFWDALDSAAQQVLATETV